MFTAVPLAHASHKAVPESVWVGKPKGGESGGENFAVI